jgi:hypothetical protein
MDWQEREREHKRGELAASTWRLVYGNVQDPSPIMVAGQSQPWVQGFTERIERTRENTGK